MIILIRFRLLRICFIRGILSPFFLQYLEYNFSKGIDLRSQTGAGLKYIFIPDPDHKTSISLAGIYDYLKLVDKPGNSEASEARFSFRFKTRQVMLDKTPEFLILAMFQPVINDFSKKCSY